MLSFQRLDDWQVDLQFVQGDTIAFSLDIIETMGEVSMKHLLSKMQFLVLDEADRLLAGQYSDQLKTIFGVVPKQRQTLLFSATLTDALNQLHQVHV